MLTSHSYLQHWTSLTCHLNLIVTCIGHVVHAVFHNNLNKNLINYIQLMTASGGIWSPTDFCVEKPISCAPIDLDIQIYIIYTIMSAFCSLCQFIWIPVNLECCQVFRWIPCVFMCSFLIDQLGNVPLINSNKVYDKAVAWVGSLKARRLSIPGKMPSLNVAVFSLFDFLASTLLAP